MEVAEDAAFTVPFEFEEHGGLRDADVENPVLNPIGCGMICDEVANDLAPCGGDDLFIELANHPDFRKELAHGFTDVGAEFGSQRGIRVATPIFDDSFSD